MDLNVTSTETDVIVSNPDISGQGVLIGFIGTTALAILLLLFHYILAYKPIAGESIPGETSGDATTHHAQDEYGLYKAEERPNPVDVGFLCFFRAIFRISGRWTETSHAFEECILDFCDIQIVTGIAILASGFCSLGSKSGLISTSDWHILVSLAWFSAATHLAGLTILRSSLRQRPRHRSLRVALMFVLITMLLAALVPTAFFDWGNNNKELLPRAAKDFFNLTVGFEFWKEHCTYDYVNSFYPLDKCSSIIWSKTLQSMIISILLVLIGFTTRSVRLYRTTSVFVLIAIRKRISRVMKRLVRHAMAVTPSDRYVVLASLWIAAVVLPAIGLHICMRWTLDIYSSVLTEIVWLVFVFAWGLTRLLVVRAIQTGTQASEMGESQEIWTFGQTIAVALLASPIFLLACKLAPSFVSGLYRKRDTNLAGILGLNSMETLRQSPTNSFELDSLCEDTRGASRRNLCDLASDEGSENPEYDSSTYGKLRFLAASLDNSAQTTFSWLPICVGFACVAWLTLALMAIAFTNYFVPVKQPQADIDVNNALIDQLSFWFISPAMLGYVAFVYPVAGSLTAALGIRLQWRQLVRHHKLTLGMGKRTSLGFICLFGHGVSFTVGLMMAMLLPTDMLGPASGVGMWVLTAFGTYLFYLVLCIFT